MYLTFSHISQSPKPIGALFHVELEIKHGCWEACSEQSALACGHIHNRDERTPVRLLGALRS